MMVPATTLTFAYGLWAVLRAASPIHGCVQLEPRQLIREEPETDHRAAESEPSSSATSARGKPYIRFGVATAILFRTDFYACGFTPAAGGGCSLSPMLRVTWEIGRPRVTFLAEIETAPVPHWGSTGFFAIQAAGGVIGISGGNERIRGAATAALGAIYARLQARLTITPWVDSLGHRHGLELAAGWAGFTMCEFVASYRIVPGLQKWRRHRSERRERKRATR